MFLLFDNYTISAYYPTCQRGEEQDRQQAPWLLLSDLNVTVLHHGRAETKGLFAFQTVLHTIARACMGCVDRNTGSGYAPGLKAKQPFCQGLRKIKGTTVEAAFFRLNDFLKGFWVDAVNADTGNGLDDSTLARPMGKKHV